MSEHCIVKTGALLEISRNNSPSAEPEAESEDDRDSGADEDTVS